jgi:octaheme c-type cytochrome (tetrathionate reductase family)
MQSSKNIWYKVTFAVALSFIVAGLLLGKSVSAQARLQDITPTPTGPQDTIDHSQLPVLHGPFDSPQAVTRACLSCHAEAAQEMMHTVHWTWEFVNEATGQTLGKKTLINNFCISTQSNEPRCTSCHVGYGWGDENFDFTAQENVDCLVCHDTTGEYKKFPTGAGSPVSEPKEFPAGSGNIWNPPDLATIAQNIGSSSRQTCGSCHFYGGGGDEVKHGDLDSSLVNPAFELDVHMSLDGQDFTCTTCHMTDDHQIAGSRYSMDPEQWKGCEDCHGEAPHELATLNQHAQKVACQTCHIPEYARGGIPTKMTWDWSKAGQLTSEGKPVTVKDETGHVIYDGQKGEFTYAANVVPEYVWFNGQVEYTLAGDKIDPSVVIDINSFLGDKDDPLARIRPVKRFVAVQPYDMVNDILVIPHLFGKDDSAYWGNYDWNKAIEFGMQYAGLPYSGEYGFVETHMYWPITHMVAPASEALTCKECHTTEDGRLDFAGLGYNEADVSRLTVFPPTLTIENLAAPQYAPETCADCHSEEYALWKDNTHGSKGVGCISCHKLESEGEHPVVPFTMEKGAETCGSCHLKEYDEWKASAHGQVNVDCSSCHNPHSQQQMVVDENMTTCETCHRDLADDVQHSTHQAAGLICTDCHKNTDQDTGHTFTVGSDTCLKCHAETIHSSNLMTVAGANLGSREVESITEVIEQEPPAKSAGAGIVLPAWLLLVGGVVLGGGVHWLLSTRRLSEANGEPETEAEINDETEE